MRLAFLLAIAALLSGAISADAQQWQSWRKGYERELDRRDRNWSQQDFDAYWEDATWPERKARNTVSSEGYRDRRDPYSDSMYGGEFDNNDYRNPYRDYDDPDADGYGDSNRFNNDSDYLSPAELHYEPRFRPVFFGKEVYDEREQRWDDRTMGHRGYGSTVRSPVSSAHGDMPRWK
jgi:opacity protein-like surface antigen